MEKKSTAQSTGNYCNQTGSRLSRGPVLCKAKHGVARRIGEGNEKADRSRCSFLRDYVRSQSG